jgi:hypothetical protein
VGRLPQVTIAHVTQGALQGHTNVQLELRLTQLYSVRARSACPDVLLSSTQTHHLPNADRAEGCTQARRR